MGIYTQKATMNEYIADQQIVDFQKIELKKKHWIQI